MEYRFSTRIGALKPSAIREILKVTQNPDVISFAAGNPAPDAFPVAELEEIAADLFHNRAAAALQYGVSEGYEPLRQLTARRLREKYATGAPDDGILIVSGGQQGMELACKVFVNEGETVLCEDPSFIGSLNAFRSYGVNLVGIPMERDGMDMDALERALKTQPNVKLLYVIPTFQTPSGRVTTLAKRRRILELASRYDVMVVEDNPYFELRYSGDYVPAIKTMDTEGRVIYVGSYSKVLAPGIRLGYVCANEQVLQKLTVAKQVSDVHTNLFFQMAATAYLERYDLDAHIAQVRAIYKTKRDAMAEALSRRADGLLRFDVPDGGLFLWCELPLGMDGCDLCLAAGKKGVAAVPGCSFLADESQVSNAVRLNFSLPSLEQIEKGVALLAEAAKSL